MTWDLIPSSRVVCTIKPKRYALILSVVFKIFRYISESFRDEMIKVLGYEVGVVAAFQEKDSFI